MSDEIEAVEAEDKPKRGRPAKAEVPMVRVKIVRDTWGDDKDALAIGAGRIPAGTEIEVTAEAAMDGIEAGVYSRVRD